MEIVFIAITRPTLGTHYAGTRDAIKAAEKRSGCRVWFISDNQGATVNFCSLNRYWKTAQKLLDETTYEARNRWAVASILRWLVLRDFIVNTNDLVWPILCLDYDVIVFSDLTKAFAPFAPFDFCLPVYPTGGTTAAYSVHRIEPLDACVELVFDMAKRVPSMNDMALWTEMYQTRKWNVGNLLPETETGLFDMNMHSGAGDYMMEPSSVPLWGPETKRITWQDKNPYFTRIKDGKLVKAHWIHCWGSYKGRTAELLKQSEI